MKSSQRQFLVVVDGLTGTWASKSGGEKTADTSKVYDGGNKVPEVLGGPAEVGELTLGRPYDPERDHAMLTRLLSLVGEWRTTVTSQPLRSDMSVVPGTKPRVYSNCLLTSVSDPESDASSGDAATLEIKFDPADVA